MLKRKINDNQDLDNNASDFNLSADNSNNHLIIVNSSRKEILSESFDDDKNSSDTISSPYSHSGLEVRDLKPELVPWFTPAGQLLLEESLIELKQTFERNNCNETESLQLKTILSTCWISKIYHIWRAQENDCTCGLASLAIILSDEETHGPVRENATGSSDSYLQQSRHRVTESEVVQSVVNAAHTSIVSVDHVLCNGLTLDEITNLVRHIRVRDCSISCVRTVYAQDLLSLTDPVNYIRVRLRKALESDFVSRYNDNNLSVTSEAPVSTTTSVPETRVILNYCMATLGQGREWGGHFSPLAAYHSVSDSFLILDTWPHTEPVWASASQIWSAINTRDDTSDKSRGWIEVDLLRDN